MNRDSGSVVLARGGFVLVGLAFCWALAASTFANSSRACLMRSIFARRLRLGGTTSLGRVFGPLGLLADDLQVRLGLLERPLDGVAPLEAVGPGTGADPGAVLGDPADGHEPAADQHREHLGQEALQRRLVVDPEVVEHVIVDRHRAAEPAVRVAGLAESCQLPAAGDPLRGGVEPERHEQLRVGGRPPRRLAACPDRVEEPGEVPGLDQSPDQARVVVVGEQFVERAGPHEHLLSVGPPQSRWRSGAEVDRGPLRRPVVALQVGK